MLQQLFLTKLIIKTKSSLCLKCFLHYRFSDSLLPTILLTAIASFIGVILAEYHRYDKIRDSKPCEYLNINASYVVPVAIAGYAMIEFTQG